MRLLLAGLLTALGLSSASAATIDALYRGLETSDTGAVTRFVEDYYRDAGISTNDTLTWETQGFIEIVNWYNQYTEVIMLSALPDGTAEADAYWQNWADILTGGTWNWRAFFKDDAEAALIANFNQFLLAAHEYGHALTYRYDPGHESRADYEINCREYPADRLAAALLEEVAEKDQRLAALKARYRLLIGEINTHIAPENRYQLPAFAVLDADCKVLHIEQPTDDPATMTPYASAFFVRHGLLQAEDLPPLAEVYEKYLFPHWRERQPEPSGRAGAVTTGGPVPTDLRVVPGGLAYEHRELAFAPDGALYVIETGEDTNTTPPRVRFSYGPAGGPVEVAIPPHALTEVPFGEYDFLSFSSHLPLGPDRFIVLSGGNTIGGARVLAFDVRRAGHGWTLHVVDLEPDPEAYPGISYAHLLTTPAGGLAAMLFDYRRPDAENRWRRLELDPETLAITSTGEFPDAAGGNIVALGPQGEVYFFDDHQIRVATPDGKASGYAGSLLQGFKDNADPMLAEFAMSGSHVRLLPDGGMEVLDYNDAIRSFVIRHVAAAGH